MCVCSHGRRFAHWTEDGRQTLNGTFTPVFCIPRKRKCPDPTVRFVGFIFYRDTLKETAMKSLLTTFLIIFIFPQKHDKPTKRIQTYKHDEIGTP